MTIAEIPTHNHLMASASQPTLRAAGAAPSRQGSAPHLSLRKRSKKALVVWTSTIPAHHERPTRSPNTKGEPYFDRRRFEGWVAGGQEQTQPSSGKPFALHEVVHDTAHTRRHAHLLETAEAYRLGTSSEGYHDFCDLLGERALGYLQQMQADPSFPYQHLKHQLPPPTVRPKERGVEAELLNGSPPRARPPTRPFGGPFAHTQPIHSFSTLPRWKSDTPLAIDVYKSLSPGEYDPPILAPTSGSQARICSRIEHTGGAALSRSDTTAGMRRGPGCYMPLNVPLASVNSHSLGMRAIGWWDDRYPNRASWSAASGGVVDSLIAEREALEAFPPPGHYNPCMSHPSMPRAPKHQGLLWHPPRGDAALEVGRPSPSYGESSTGEEVGPSSYNTPAGGPSQLVHSAPSAVVVGRPIVEEDSEVARIGPSTYHLPERPYTTEPQSTAGRHVTFSATPFIAPVLDAEAKAASRAKQTQMDEQLRQTLSPEGAEIARRHKAALFQKRDERAQAANRRRDEKAGKDDAKREKMRQQMLGVADKEGNASVQSAFEPRVARVD